MSDESYREPTPEEKLLLAQEINALIDLHYPALEVGISTDVLLLALMSRTSSYERRNLGVGFH